MLSTDNQQAEQNVRLAVVAVFASMGLPMLLWSLADLLIQRSSKYPISSTYIALGVGIFFTAISLRLWLTRRVTERGADDIQFQGQHIAAVSRGGNKYLNVRDVLRVVGINDATKVGEHLAAMRRHKECVQAKQGLFTTAQNLRPILEREAMGGNRKANLLLRKL